MATITRVDNPLPSAPVLKRVAAYCRVSQETERLMHSLSAQISYYSEMIQKTPGWSYAGVYADEFISGTSTKNRSEYQRLMDDCDKGLIDIVLCKSISRFSRNTVDLLEAVRHLKEIGVEIRFEKEKVTNMTADGELMMTLLAVFSQSESESISENCKWGIRKRFQNGTIGAANKHILGYRYDEEKQQYVIIPEEVEIVRRMFALYLEGKSLQAICDELNDRGYRTTLGCLFQEASLNNLIHNEIYAGDLLRQKTVTVDPLTKMKVKNRGQLNQYYYEDAHEAILDRETYEKVKTEMKRRSAMLNPTYCFTGRIICGHCGMTYTRKKSTVKGKEYVHWICRSKKEVGMTCDSPNFREDDLKRICADALGWSSFDEETSIATIRQITVQPGGMIEFDVSGGEKKLHELPPKPEKKPKPESEKKRPSNIFDGMIFCGKCGRRFGRAMSDTSDGGHLYWYCRAKSNHGETCDSVNYADTEIREIFCSVIGLDSFDDDYFKTTVERMVVLDTGSIDFYLKDGTVRQFETLKLRNNLHETTSTDEFTGKLICSCCGNEYHRYCGRGKYVYWRCAGKSKVRTVCANQDYADFNLRKVTAYIMGTSDFNKNAFTEQVDHISVSADGLEYHFKDGRIESWRKR